MFAVEAKGISKSFPGVRALNNISIGLELGKVHCIVGENGAGKSTLIKILTGVYHPDQGSISILGQDALKQRQLFRKIGYVPQEIDLFPSLTVAENIFLPFNSDIYKDRFVRRKILDRQALPILDKYHIKAGPNDVVGKIPISEQQLVQIAHAIVNKSSEIILLDEPTTSLVSNEIMKLFEVIGELKKANKAVVFISHKLEEVFAVGDEITILRNGVQVGNALVKECSIDWVVEKMVGQEIDPDAQYRPVGIEPSPILRVNNITGKGFRNISFELKEGEILGFAGLVGAGRSEIVQGIFGYKPFWSGSVELFGRKVTSPNPTTAIRNGVLYLPEARKQQGIFPYLSVLENIALILLDKLKSLFLISRRKETSLGAQVVKTYNIKAESLAQKIMFLSGGNQQKVIIGRAMSRRPRILIFDEPTKGIDVGAKAEIYRLMKEIAEKEKISIILISSEIDELIKCSNRILVVYRGEKAGEFQTGSTDRTDIIEAMIGSGQTTKNQEI
jgi:ABC-type sugar transport system ATPase subunit